MGASVSDFIVLEDGLRVDGRYVVHLMGNAPIEYALPAGVEPQRSRDAGAYALRAEWKFRGACEIVCPEYDWRRVVVLWGLEPGERISEQAVEAAQMYRDIFFEWPESLWVERIPRGVEYGTFIKLPCEGHDNEMVMVDAEFVPVGFLAVGRGGTQPEMIIDPLCFAK